MYHVNVTIGNGTKHFLPNENTIRSQNDALRGQLCRSVFGDNKWKVLDRNMKADWWTSASPLSPITFTLLFFKSPATGTEAPARATASATPLQKPSLFIIRIQLQEPSQSTADCSTHKSATFKVCHAVRSPARTHLTKSHR